MPRHLCAFLLLTFAFATALCAEKATLITRTFRIPPDFMAQGGGISGGAAPAAPADPFAAGVPSTSAPVPHRVTAKEILEAQGIVFPEGASASFNPATGLLTITNSQANLDLVESYVDALSQQVPRIVVCTVTVVEGPGELIRQANAAASRTANATQELTTLLGYAKNPGSNVHVVGDAFLETKSGTRATTEAVREHTYASDLEMDAKSRSSVAHEMRQIGLRLEYEPTIGADGTTIESTVSLDLNPALPSERQVSITEPITGGTAEFPTTSVPSAHFVTGLTSTSGSTKLIGITKPVGTPKQGADILWAAFLTTTVRKVEGLQSSRPALVAQPAKLPPGMIATTINAPDGLFNFPVLNHSIIGEPPKPQFTKTLKDWFEENGVAPVKDAVVEQRDDVLQIINTPDNIERIATLIDELLSQRPKTVAFTLHTLQAPAAFLRDLTRQTITAADDAAMLTTVEAAVTRGEATFINSVFLETKSGTRATHESACEHVYLSEFGTNDKGQPHLAFDTRKVGSVFEVEPIIGADGRTLEINFNHELHPAAPETRREHFRDPASNKPFDMSVVDFHSAKVTTGISMTKGGTKLISLNKPTGRNDVDVLWATFLRCDLVPHIPKPRQPSPEKKKAASVDPKAWNTRMFRVPPDFLSSGPGAPQITAKWVLEGQGISFPEGAMASYNPGASVMFVKNTNENLVLVEAFIETIMLPAPRLTAFTTHVLQGPGSLLRRITNQAASKSDHRAELDELLAAVKTGTVQHLNTARIETKSGTRASSKQANEHTAISDISVNDKGEPVFEQEMREVGFRVELEPTVGADGETIELTLAPEFHTAPPFEHREHVIDTQGRRLEFPLTDYRVAKVTTGITMTDGTARLLSLYKPTGRPEFEKEDILQVIFITCDLLRIDQ